MISLRTTITDRGLSQRLREAAKAASGKHNAMRAAFRAAGSVMLRDVQEDYVKRARGRGWKQLGPITTIMRRRGKGSKIESWEDLKRRRKEMEIMRDTGRLFNSLAPGRAGNVFKVSDLSVEVGTNDSRARTLNDGGRTRFEFDEKRFERNVRERLPGRKPKKTATGRKSRAKRNWNPMFFLARNWLRKLDGKSLPVPRRRIVSKPGPLRRRRYTRIIADALRGVLET